MDTFSCPLPSRIPDCTNNQSLLETTLRAADRQAGELFFGYYLVRRHDDARGAQSERSELSPAED